MAKIITDLDSAIGYINNLFEGDSTPPTSGEEDYTVWMGLLNIAINIWEMEEGMQWRELLTTLAASADGDKTTVANTHSYDLPTLFNVPASGFVFLTNGDQEIAYQVVSVEKAQILPDEAANWCYFTSTTIEFNPESPIYAGSTIEYSYYKYASKLTTGTSTFEMSDPFFAVYYAISELKKDEGDTSALTIATQKLESMKTKNSIGGWYQQDSLMDGFVDGFGI